MMKLFRLEEMSKGWFVGDFTPTAFGTAGAEVAVKRYNPGDKEGAHHHKVATELTVVLGGTVRMNGIEYQTGQIILIEPGETTDFEAVTEVTTVVVKVPCVAGDKYT